MPLALSSTCRNGARLFTAAGIALLAACGPAPQGGFHGFPPAAVTTLVLQPRALPVSYEYVGQTAGSKEVEVRARVTGILEKRLFAEGAAVKAAEARLAEVNLNLGYTRVNAPITGPSSRANKSEGASLTPTRRCSP
jgi:multidrug efflux pump subunit AcrA (membrane-fusion protein)